MSYRISRFACPSLGLELRGLASKARKPLWTGLALAVAAHLSLTQISGWRKEQRIVKPLTTQFVKRQPRLTKPLELKKRPRPKRRSLRRNMVTIRARVGREPASSPLRSIELLGRLAQPQTSLSRTTGFASASLEPEAVAQAVESAREVAQQVDMALELMDIDALDTGKHHALVIEDPEDKGNIRGFCHLAILYSRTIYPPSPAGPRYSFEHVVLPGFLRIAVAMNQFTDIRTDILGRLGPDDTEIFKAPWLLFYGLWTGTGTWQGFKLTSSELENLGRYLISGGFVFADCDNNWVDKITPCYTTLHNTLVDAVATQGIDVAFERLPSSHSIYHCYFDFDGPPVGGDASDVHSYGDRARVLRYTEGLIVEGRLIAMLSGKNYVGAWTSWGQPGTWETWDPKRSFQFVVNTIIFALTQEGSITRRVMDEVR